MIEMSADKAKLTLEGDDVIAFRDVCNAAALAVNMIKNIGSKTTCGRLSQDNEAWIERTDAFLSELKGRAFMLQLATAVKKEDD